MRQYRVDIFDRKLSFLVNDVVTLSRIDDDYISSKANTLEIHPTSLVSAGDFILLKNDLTDFFGVITDVAPGEHRTSITYKSFITIFDETFLFDTKKQGTSTASHPTLEQTIKDYITSLYITTTDTYQRLPITVSIASGTQTSKWSLGITPDTEGGHYSIIHLYSVLIVEALKKYGVGISVIPNFSSKTINLVIGKRSANFNIDGNLKNVTVATLKYNDKPTGVNKLTVHNTEDYSQSITFYVHPDRSWDTENTNRISPVSKQVTGTAPDQEYEDPDEGFAVSAVDSAYSILEGQQWDNLIELEVSPTDKNIQPLDMEVGQTVTLMYKDGKYKSILTGKIIEPELIILLFGSERIEYSKRLR